MPVIDVELIEESKTRYLTYALSVVNSRALPDVRDGLKPVQRRILYAMVNNLGLMPDKHHRKSAAVVGEVLARFHPHGDAACYEAMVRMAQDFNFRYPLVDGQGNFGSLDGDSAAAYRYTEARLTPIALEVIGDVGEETVDERDNFDQTVKEPVVLPARVPNLLINGASGIAVGMATSIPPHNLSEVIKSLLLLIEDADVSDTRLFGAIKGPDFPTGCLVLNTRAELNELYRTGRGVVRMRAEYSVEHSKRGKEQVVVTSIPYNIDKSQLVEKIADLIATRKVPQLVDIRDESTDVVRVVMELASGADAEKAMTYLFKHTPLQSNFNVNMTALIPTSNPLSGRPVLLRLREMLKQFVDFRLDVTRRKLLFEKSKLDARIHLLEGLAAVFDALNEVIQIVRKSDGRMDGAKKLQQRFKLSEQQALFIVDLRIYQLSRTSIEEVRQELAEKTTRVKQIVKILKSEAALKAEIAADLNRITETYGDARRSKIVTEFEEPAFVAEEYVQHEDVYVIVTADGWLKRIRQTNDPQNSRLREGDRLSFAKKASTRDSLALFTNMGNVYVQRVFDVPSTSGFGDPVQKLFKFGDGEQIVDAMIVPRGAETNGNAGGDEKSSPELVLFTNRGLGFRTTSLDLSDTKKNGRRVMRLAAGDALSGVSVVDAKIILFLTQDGYALCLTASEIPVLSGVGKGVIIQKVSRDDRLIVACGVTKTSKVKVVAKDDVMKEVDISAITIGNRARRGDRVIKRGTPVLRLAGYGIDAHTES